MTCAPCAAPPTPSACEYWGRRAVHDVSIDYYGVNGAILAPMRRASHAFEFFNIAQFKRDAAPASSTGTRPGQPRGASCRQIIASSKVSHALLASLAHARQDAAAQRDGRLGDRITFRESRQAASTKEHTSGQLPITLEAIEEHGIKYQDHK